MSTLPDEVEISALPYAQEITDTLYKFKNDPDTSAQFADMAFPDLTSMEKVKIDMGGDSDFELPADLLELIKGSDVTTIVANTKTLVNYMFSQMTPEIIADIDDGVSQGITGITKGITQMSGARTDMEKGYQGIGSGIDGMGAAVTAQTDANEQLDTAATMLKGFRGGNLPDGMSLLDFIPEGAKAEIPDEILRKLAEVKSIADLDNLLADLDGAIESMNNSAEQLADATQMLNGFAGGNLPDGMTILDFIPKEAQDAMPESVLEMLEKVESLSDLKIQIAALAEAIDSMTSAADQLSAAIDMMNGFAGGNLPAGMTLLDFIPDQVQNAMPESVLAMLTGVKNLADLQSDISALENTVKQMSAAETQMTSIQTILNNLAAGDLPSGMNMLSFVPASVQSALSTATLDDLAEIYSFPGLNQQLEDLQSNLDLQSDLQNELENVNDLLTDGSLAIADGQSIGTAVAAAGYTLSAAAAESLATLYVQDELTALLNNLAGVISGLNMSIGEMNSVKTLVQPIFVAFAAGNFPVGMLLTDLIPPYVQSQIPASILGQLAAISSFSDLDTMVESMQTALTAQNAALGQMNSLAQILTALSAGEIPKGMSLLNFIPDAAKENMPEDILAELENISSVDELEDLAADLEDAVAAQEDADEQMQDLADMLRALSKGNIPSQMSLTDFIPSDAKEEMPDEVLNQLEEIRTVSELEDMTADLNDAVAAQESARGKLLETRDSLTTLADGLIPSSMNFTDFIPPEAKEIIPDTVLDDLSDIHSLGDIYGMMDELNSAISKLKAQINESLASRGDMGEAMSEMDVNTAELQKLLAQLEVLQAAVPDAFAQAGTNYLREVDDKGSTIETAFQATLNQGYRNMYICVAAFNLLGLLILLLYKDDKRKKDASAQEEKSSR